MVSEGFPVVMNWKTTCFSSLIVLMSAAQDVSAAENLSGIGRATFDLRSVFSRPFLQKKPVSDFREPVSISEEFKKDRRSAAVPEQHFERISEAALYRDEADDFLTDEAMQKTNAVEENRDIFRLVRDTLPSAEIIEDAYVEDAERSDVLATNMLLSFESDRQMRDMLDEQDDFMMKITGQALIDREYKVYASRINEIDRKTEEVVLSLPEDTAPFEVDGFTVKSFVLSPESFEGQSLLNYDRMIIFQYKEDVLDIGRHVETTKEDWAAWLHGDYEQNLDLTDDSATIPEEDEPAAALSGDDSSAVSEEKEPAADAEDAETGGEGRDANEKDGVKPNE